MIANLLQDWADIWGIPPEALDDLARRSTVAYAPEGSKHASKSEAYTQSLVRLGAPGYGLVLWRNNVGAFKTDGGTFVRCGLANDSKQLNETIKSGDLIGWETVIITEAMVGSRIAQFVSIECKELGWEFGRAGKDTEQGKREHAQKRWLEMVIAAGGKACFSTGGLPQ